MSLLFEVTDLLAELHAFRELAGRMLAGNSEQVLHTCAAELTGISRSSTPQRWQIHATNPVVTQPSRGSYMHDNQGGLVVYAEVTFVWTLHPERPAGNTQPAKQVRLNGLGSTAIRVMRGTPTQPGDAVEIALWKMEIADLAAPGTFFHVQVPGREGEDYFPKALDVPRLPSVLNSPFACMEFVLGELFQADWPRLAMKDSAPGLRWRGIQARRHAQHLHWALQQVAAASGSPWVMWKGAQPPEGLFLPA
jgi:hypothetical protein